MKLVGSMDLMSVDCWVDWRVASTDMTSVDKMDASWVDHSAAGSAASMANQWVARWVENLVASTGIPKAVCLVVKLVVSMELMSVDCWVATLAVLMEASSATRDKNYSRERSEESSINSSDWLSIVPKRGFSFLNTNKTVHCMKTTLVILLVT